MLNKNIKRKFMLPTMSIKVKTLNMKKQGSRIEEKRELFVPPFAKLVFFLFFFFFFGSVSLQVKLTVFPVQKKENVLD